MLINLSLAPEAIGDISKARMGINAKTLQSHLFELIRRFCRIVQMNDREAVELVRFIRSEALTPDEQNNWRELLMYLRKQKRFSTATPPIDTDFGQLADPLIAACFRSVAPMLSIIPEVAYKSIFTDEDGVHSASDDIEFVTPVTAASSALVQRLVSMVNDGVFSSGTPRDVVWEDLFAPLARSSREIVVYDSYLYSEMWRRSSESTPSREHLAWFVDKVDLLGGSVRSISLVGAAGDPRGRGLPSDPVAITDMLFERFDGRLTNLDELNCYVVANRRNMHHDRHIGFSSGQVIDLPAGLDRLSRSTLRDVMNFSYRYTTSSVREFRRTFDSAIKRDNTSFVSIVK